MKEEDKLVSIHYDTMEHLLNREKSMCNRLAELLNTNGTEQYISDSYISVTKNKYILNFILSPNNY